MIKKLVMPLLLTSIASTANAGVIVNEIMNNPQSMSDPFGEWFELYNDGPTNVDLKGWTFSDNGINAFTINSSLVIDSGDFLVFGYSNDGFDKDYVYGNGMIFSNGLDEIILTDHLGNVVDSVGYGGLGYPNPNGASLAFTGGASDDNSSANDWSLSTAPTPVFDFGTAGACNTDVGQVCSTPNDSVSVSEPFSLSLLVMGLFGLAGVRTARS